MAGEAEGEEKLIPPYRTGRSKEEEKPREKGKATSPKTRTRTRHVRITRSPGRPDSQTATAIRKAAPTIEEEAGQTAGGAKERDPPGQKGTTFQLGLTGGGSSSGSESRLRSQSTDSRQDRRRCNWRGSLSEDHDQQDRRPSLGVPDTGGGGGHLEVAPLQATLPARVTRFVQRTQRGDVVQGRGRSRKQRGI